MKKMRKLVIGNWRITGMEVWDADYFDMEASAHITIRKDLTGEFQFGLMQAQLDGKIESANASSRSAFSWSGFDENDPVNGRGWLTDTGLEADKLSLLSGDRAFSAAPHDRLHHQRRRTVIVRRAVPRQQAVDP